MRLGRCVSFLIVALFLSSIAVGADDSQKRHDLDALLARANAANLRSHGPGSFHLRLELHAEHITAKPLDGTYDEVWTGSDAWRREIAFPEFKQVEVGDKDGRWVDRSIDFRPHPVYLIARLLDSLMAPAPRPDEKVIKVHKEKKDGTELQCADLGTGPAHHTLCFDDLGRLFSSEYPDLRMEYRDYQKFGDAMFPRKLGVYENRERVLEVNVAELGLASDKLAQFAGRSTSAFQLAPCERWVPGVPVKKVAPQYPERARMARVQGAVRLYALLAADGAVQRVKVLQSAGAILDQAAAEAVGQWVYLPTDCGSGRPLPTEIEVWVNFTLYLQARATIHTTPAQKLALTAIESASPEIAPQLMRSYALP
jgi:TonB family protein